MSLSEIAHGARHLPGVHGPAGQPRKTAITSSKYLLAPLSLWPPANAGPIVSAGGPFLRPLSGSALLALASFFTSFFPRAGHLRCSIYRKVAPCYCDSTAQSKGCDAPVANFPPECHPTPPFRPRTVRPHFTVGFLTVGATMSCSIAAVEPVWSVLVNWCLFGLNPARFGNGGWTSPSGADVSAAEFMCRPAAPKASGFPTKACPIPGTIQYPLHTPGRTCTSHWR